MFKGQLELSLGNAARCSSAARRQRRLQRARWWFDRMREAVDRAENQQPLVAPYAPSRLVKHRQIP